MVNLSPIFKNKKMNQRQYVAEVRRQLVNFYRQKRDGYSVSDEQRGRIEGFMQAGVSLGIFSERQRDQLIDNVYEQVFGTEDSCASTIECYQKPITVERIGHLKTDPHPRESQALSSAVQWSEETRDYSEYDTPTVHRLGLSKN